MLTFLDGIIPARFLLLCAYTIITIVAIYAREANVIACMPAKYSSAEFSKKELSIKSGYIAALGLVIFELAGFVSGVSTFIPVTTVISILTHGIASIMMASYVMFEWDCDFYWWIFIIGSIIPAFMEIFSLISMLFLWSAWGISRLRYSASRSSM
ncbi:transmembrane protein 107-like [Ischnura elegans]|uniref:transmembrane protein 107-like n=1 Tax=Ischnura elegans TaxID=197161 RepID=UPI001ED88D59|nr:transmembrane protein 107-like [Ischnura elegans]